jgi:excisionase family DNA binding protein
MKPASSEEKSEGARASILMVAGAHPTDTLRPGGNAFGDGFEGAVRVVLPEKLLTIREVAERLGVCRATVYAMVERGALPAVRIGSAVRVHPADLQALVARRRR